MARLRDFNAQNVSIGVSCATEQLRVLGKVARCPNELRGSKTASLHVEQIMDSMSYFKTLGKCP